VTHAERCLAIDCLSSEGWKYNFQWPNDARHTTVAPTVVAAGAGVLVDRWWDVMQRATANDTHAIVQAAAAAAAASR